MSKLVVSKKSNRVTTCSPELGHFLSDMKKEAMHRSEVLKEPFFLSGTAVLMELHKYGLVPKRTEESDRTTTYYFGA